MAAGLRNQDGKNPVSIPIFETGSEGFGKSLGGMFDAAYRADVIHFSQSESRWSEGGGDGGCRWERSDLIKGPRCEGIEDICFRSNPHGPIAEGWANHHARVGEPIRNIASRCLCLHGLARNPGLIHRENAVTPAETEPPGILDQSPSTKAPLHRSTAP